MRTAIVVALLVGLTAVPALAGDGQVPQGRLKALGLSGAQVMSDSQAMDIRGMSSSARATGLSLTAVALFDPETGSSVFDVQSFGTKSTAENGGLNNSSSASGFGVTGAFKGLDIGRFNATAFSIGGFFGRASAN